MIQTVRIAYYQYFDENGDPERNTANPVDTSALNFDDSGSFIIITDPNGQEVLNFGTNNDQGEMYLELIVVLT